MRNAETDPQTNFVREMIRSLRTDIEESRRKIDLSRGRVTSMTNERQRLQSEFGR